MEKEKETINRLIIVGNGFDLAHGLKSSYSDFMHDYLLTMVKNFFNEGGYCQDNFISLSYKKQFPTNYIFQPHTEDQNHENFFKIFSEFFPEENSELDLNCFIKFENEFFKIIYHNFFKKNWVDVELAYFQELKKCIINGEVDDQKLLILNDEFEYFKMKFFDYLLNQENFLNQIHFDEDLNNQIISDISPEEYLIPINPITNYPNRTFFLNFNYTDISKKYCENPLLYFPIHGQINFNENNLDSLIFGYGDDMDEHYQEFEKYNEDELFRHIKSFKYLSSDHYFNLLGFLEVSKFQVHIYGHSCGLSDRTLLNTIFEHENCISIKPYYHKISENEDDYNKIIYAISRNFNDKKKFRARVVNKTYCKRMAQPVDKIKSKN